MRASSYRLLASGLTLGLLACSDQIPPPQPASFERPTRVAFLCVDTNAPDKLTQPESQLKPLAACTPTPLDQPENLFSLHALVTQSSRGEVAAVDLRAQRIIDSRNDIPGFTFVPAGELPAAIVVAPNHPEVTYVANSGSRDISVLRTAATLRLDPGEVFTKQPRVRLQLDANSGSVSPFDMVLSPDEDALFVSAPDAGLLLRIPIRRCAEGEPTCPENGELDSDNIRAVSLDASLAKADSAGTVPTTEPYRLVCDGTPLLSGRTADAPSAAIGAMDQQPRPAGLAIDAPCDAGECTRRLLVADKRLPIIHAIDLDALAADAGADAILTPIVTGAPTERVVVTPRVPVSLNESDGETQYVYAIDANDGSVLALQDGKLLNVGVDPAQRSDRVSFGRSFVSGAPAAISLEVVTPAFNPRATTAQQWIAPSSEAASGAQICTDTVFTTRTADRLRGVFLSVGFSDATVRVVDVHDMELRSCRDGHCDIDNAGYDPYPIVRNRPRIDVTYVTPTTGAVAPAFGPIVTPQFEVESSIILVKDDGTTSDPRTTGLDCVPCPETEAVSFPIADEVIAVDGGTTEVAPNDGVVAGVLDAGAAVSSGEVVTSTGALACTRGQGRVCSLADPWVDPGDWGAIFEGTIPGTRGGRGRFIDVDSPDNRSQSLEFAGEVHFCDVGVLGDQDARAGDQLVITSVLPSTDAQPGLDPIVRQACEALITARDVDNTAIAFRIKAAFDDRLVIDPALINVPRDVRRVAADWTLVSQCFDSLLAYQVHTRDSYVVVGAGGTSFRHRVIKNDAGRCVNDMSKDARLTARAYTATQFDNGFVSFKTKPGNPEANTLLRITSASNTPKLIFDAAEISTGELRGVMPVDLKYNPIDQQLYIVDITARGLIVVPLAPMPRAVALSFQ